MSCARTVGGWIRPTKRTTGGGPDGSLVAARRRTTGALPVFGLAIVEIWAAVPVGIALGVAPPLVWVLTVAGSFVSVVAVATAGDALRERLTRHRRPAVPNTGRLYGLWVSHGVAGWGLVSPLVMAPLMGTAVGILLGAPRRPLVVWMAAGTVLWTTILVVAGTLGLGLIHAVN